MNRKEQKRKGYNYKSENLMTAIVAVREGDELTFKKYRNIRRAVSTVSNFETFILKTFPEALHVNYYGGITRNFLHRTTFKKQ